MGVPVRPATRSEPGQFHRCGCGCGCSRRRWLDPGDGLESVEPVRERAHRLLDPRRELLDRGGQLIDTLEVQSAQERVVIAEVPGQCLDQGRDLGAHPSARHVRPILRGRVRRRSWQGAELRPRTIPGPAVIGRWKQSNARCRDEDCLPEKRVRTPVETHYGRMTAIRVTVSSSMANRGPSRPIPESFTPP